VTWELGAEVTDRIAAGEPGSLVGAWSREVRSTEVSCGVRDAGKPDNEETMTFSRSSFLSSLVKGCS
jgi:hypothetical protein